MRAVDMTAALGYAHRLLEYAYDPPYLPDTQDVPDLENLVRVLEEQSTLLGDSGLASVPQVACVRPWEGDAAVTVEESGPVRVVVVIRGTHRPVELRAPRPRAPETRKYNDAVKR